MTYEQETLREINYIVLADLLLTILIGIFVVVKLV